MDAFHRLGYYSGSEFAYCREAFARIKKDASGEPNDTSKT
jgi:hypothetical protein